MKFQTKIILYYTTIALLLSLAVGIVLYKTGLDEEIQSQKSSLTTTSTQLVAQMEDRMGRMEAIIYYILSDADMLSSIQILGMVSDGTVPIMYIREAEQTLDVGLSTEYLLRNSYRTGFYNQIGTRITSFVRADSDIDLSIRYKYMDDLSNLPYLEQAGVNPGKTVLIGVHPDPWVGEDGPLVYSVMKEVRGYQMGYIEVENLVEDLRELNTSDPQADYQIFVNGDQQIYAGQGTVFTDEETAQILKAPDTQTISMADHMVVKASSEMYPVTVIVSKPESVISEDKRILFRTSALASMLVFMVGLIFVIFYSRILSRPLKQLQKQIEHTSLENLGQDEQEQIDSNGMDELELLVDSYHAMTRRLDQAVENEKRSLTLQMRAQFDTLQAQVNPHFIYNILNIISSRGIEDNDDLICEICSALAMILRYSTNNKERLARIEQEVSYLENYLYLAKVRYGKKLNFQVDIDPEVQKQLIPKLTLQQFAENSLAHGFDHQEGDWEIRFTGRMRKGYWEILIQDNGEGLSEEVRTRIEQQFREVRETILGHQKNMELEIGGMGLVNTYARCLLYYGKDVIFEILPSETGAVFRIGAYLKEETQA
ncbi:MAG: histidine kinase [Blautia sp.]|nr:histidine kinase [Blautia sp.]